MAGHEEVKGGRSKCLDGKEGRYAAMTDILVELCRHMPEWQIEKAAKLRKRIKLSQMSSWLC